MPNDFLTWYDCFLRGELLGFEPEFSTENDVRRAFEHIGWNVHQLQENGVTATQIRDVALESDLLLWTGTWDWFHGPNHAPGAQPLDESLTTVAECARRGIPSATLHLDVFWGVKRNGRRWWQHPMFRTGTVYTADGDHQVEWDRAGIHHVWLPPGVRHDAAHHGHPRKQYECDVAFAGSDGNGYHAEWGYRHELIVALEQMCQRRGWSFKNPGGRDPKVERGEDMNDFYASATVTVGDSLCPAKEKTRYWSDRVPEATGRGGLLIMPQIDALVDMYDGRLPMYPWGDWDRLEELVEYYLGAAEDNLYVRDDCLLVTQLGHTYVNRVQTILDGL